MSIQKHKSERKKKGEGGFRNISQKKSVQKHKSIGRTVINVFLRTLDAVCHAPQKLQSGKSLLNWTSKQQDHVDNGV